MIVGICMVKDEADVIGCTLRHLLAEGVDRIIVADNLSTDATSVILGTFDERVSVVHDNEFAYYQDRKMSRLAQQAYDEGAEWVVPFDADEIIYKPGHGTVAEFLNGLPSSVCVVEITGWDHVPNVLDDRKEPCPFRRIIHRRDVPQKLPKVAFRAADGAYVHMGNHDVSGVSPRRANGLELRHFQYRSLDQMIRKLRNGREVYEASDIHQQHGTHWRQGGALSDSQMVEKWEGLWAERTTRDPAPVRC